MIEETETNPSINGDQMALLSALRDLAPHLNPTLSNPTPLGLYSFAITTALFGVQKTWLAGSTQESHKKTGNLLWGFAMFSGQEIARIARVIDFVSYC